MSDNKVKIISEIGINHDGSLKKALEMIRVSAQCGVNICKFQLLKASEMYSRTSGTYENASGQYNIYDVVKKSELGKDWIPLLIEECNTCGVEFLTTIYDLKGLDEILPYKPKLLKLASYEISYIPLIREIGKNKIPLIISTAGSTLGDIEEAIIAYGDEKNLTIMHCNGKYPAPREMVNMAVLKTFALAFPDAKLGFSDHTEHPTEAPVASVMLGAQIIEKHFTLNKNDPGPDHSFAVDPEGLKAMVNGIRDTEFRIKRGEAVEIDPIIYGTSRKVTLADEQYIRDFCYRSIFARRNIEDGKIIKADDLIVLRNGQKQKGLHPKYLNELQGLVVNKNIKADEPINFNIFKNQNKECTDNWHLWKEWFCQDRKNILPIYGTGLHRWALRDKDIPSELVDWNSLIQSITNTTCFTNHPANFVWETCVSKEEKPAFKSELEFKKQIKQKFKYGSHFDLTKYAEFFNFDYSTFCSLNYDTWWHQIFHQKKLENKITYLFSKDKSSKKVFYPHGRDSKPETICIGAHGYGKNVRRAEKNFKSFKQWERITLNRKGNRPITSKQHQELLVQLDKSSMRNNWVAHFMLKPVIFIGCSLSQSEWDIWWLLAQRQRNLARVEPTLKSPVFIVKNKNIPDKGMTITQHLDYWESNPCGIMPLWVNDWNEGWKQFLEK
jgi:N-acetylneuraminate synthase